MNAPVVVYWMAFGVLPTLVMEPVASTFASSPGTKPSPVIVTAGRVSAEPSYVLVADCEVSSTLRFATVRLPGRNVSL